MLGNYQLVAHERPRKSTGLLLRVQGTLLSFVAGTNSSLLLEVYELRTELRLGGPIGEYIGF